MTASVMPPLVLAPLPVARPWGGTRARALLDPSVAWPADATGEWWLVSTREGASSRVLGGPFDGVDLAQLIRERPDALLGRRHALRFAHRFPLLVKLIDAGAPLSIQNHPDAAESPGEEKVETWYVVDARPGARFWLGLERGVSAEELVELARRGVSPEALLAMHPAAAGAIAHLEPGVFHALGADVVALEFQTSSDTTFRVWDWQRTPKRELHLDAALRVARRAAVPSPAPLASRRIADGPPRRDEIVRCPEYSVERLRLTAGSPVHMATDGARFEILVAIGGRMRVALPQGSVQVPRAHATLVAAEAGDYVVTAEQDAELFRCVPGDAACGGGT